MDTRRITALVLIIFPLLAIAGWFGFGFGVMGGTGPDNVQGWIAGLGENSATVKILLPIITLLFVLAVVGGLGTIKNSMDGGAGHYLAGIGFLLIILGSAGQLIETAFTLALAEASNNAAVATNMYASGQAVGALTTAASMVGFILFGIGILQQKNFSPILAGLMVVTGIYTLVFCLVDYEGQLIGIGFLGIVASLVWLGIGLLRKKS